MGNILLGLLLPLMLLFTKLGTAPVKTNEKMVELVNRQWDMHEIRFLQDNVPYYYNREIRERNTINFDTDFIVFNEDGTGVYHQSDNTIFKLNWNYQTISKNNVEFTILNFRDGNDLLVNWENILLSENRIDYSEYYIHSTGVNSLGRVTRTTPGYSCGSSFQ